MVEKYKKPVEEESPKPYRPVLNRFIAQISGALRQEDSPEYRLSFQESVGDLARRSEARIRRVGELVEKGFD
jgi:hypothetical protein